MMSFIWIVYFLILYLKIMSNSLIQVNQVVLKKTQWQIIHSRYDQLNISVYLSEGDKNAKHQKLILSIEVISETQQIRFSNKFRTSDLPSEAVTIFYDVENLYEYIQQFQEDGSRVKFNPDSKTLTIVNIVLMKNKQIKQQIDLTLIKQKMVKTKSSTSNSHTEEKSLLDASRISQMQGRSLLQQSKIMFQSLIKDTNHELEKKVALLSEHLQSFVHQIKLLKSENKVLSTALNSCNVQVLKLQKQSALIKQKINILSNEKASLSDLKTEENLKNQSGHDGKIQELKKNVDQNKWHISQINNEFQNIKQEHRQLQKVKAKIEQQAKSQSKNDHVLPLVTELRKQLFILSSRYNSLKEGQSRLGQKIYVNLDFTSNKYINNFRVVENIIEKVEGDEQRHQILGKEDINIFNLKTKSYFQIKVISSVNSGIVVGIVSEARKSERYSYDKMQCVCYDGKGFIFQQGHKIKMPCKFDNGQTIRVVLDPLQRIIHWYVGYTEIGSAFIPQSMHKMKIVPYIELYDKNDKFAING